MPPTLLLIQNNAVHNLPTGLVSGVVEWNDPLVTGCKQKGINHTCTHLCTYPTYISKHQCLEHSLEGRGSNNIWFSIGKEPGLCDGVGRPTEGHHRVAHLLGPSVHEL